MKKLHVFLLIVLTMGICVTASARVGSTERFRNAIATTAPDEFVRVTVAFWDQINTADLEKLVAGKARREWRKVTIPAMMEFADQSQNRVRSELYGMEQTGDVRNIRIIWTSNEINFEAKVSSLQGFFDRFNELRSIDLDPNIPIDQLIDTQRDVIAPPPPQINTIGWGIQDIQAPQIWSMGYTGQGIVIANIDTGCDTTHAALVGRIWHNPGEIFNNGIDDDNNGYIDDNWGWNFDSNNNNPAYVTQSHGTNTSGIMVGQAINDTIGVAPGAKLMVLKNESGGEAGYRLASQYAVRSGADVISSSLSYKWPSGPDYQAMRIAMIAEYYAGVIRANSIGNQGNSLGTYPIPFNIATPGNCPPPWLHPYQTIRGGISSVMGCGAYESNQTFATYTGRGPAAWDTIMTPSRPELPDSLADYPWRNGSMQGLMKPDVSMPTTVRTCSPGGGYETGFNGTSAATPHLGGALCLLLSAAPEAMISDVCQALKMTGDTTNINGQYHLYGTGRVRLLPAINYLMGLQVNGSLSGVVTDTITRLPMSDVRIEVQSTFPVVTTTDAEGRFFAQRVRPGNWNVVATKAGYLAAQLLSVAIDTNETTVVEIGMAGPRIAISPDTLRISVPQGASDVSFIRIENNGVDTVRWQARTLRPSSGADTTGQPLLNINVTQLTGETQLNGVEWAWGYIWATGSNSASEPNKVYKFSRTGALLASYDAPHQNNVIGLRDLAFDGQYLWASEPASGTGWIYGFDSLCVLRDSIPLANINPARAVAYDPAEQVYYVADNLSSIYGYRRNGQTARVIPNPQQSYHIFGMAWYPADPDGMPLYVFSQDSTPMMKLSKVNIATNQFRVVGLVDTTTGYTSGGLAIATDWDFTTTALLAVAKGTSQDDFIRVKELSFRHPWAVLNRTAGSVAGGVADSVRIDFSGVTTPLGDWPLEIQFTHNTPQPMKSVLTVLSVYEVSVDPNHQVGIPSTFTVGELYPNPFNPKSQIKVSLPQASNLKIVLFDRIGREAASIEQKGLQAGAHAVTVDGTNLASGLYFLKIETNAGVAVRKGVLLK
ncbi:MAG: S8 family serine peptidase [bacterium]|nr:S8 family serine peptidase [bacterium]